ncbi:hypothetical protein D1R32_gp092 [Tunisvirus fontaine2]|uniref:Uncharacterized protein n=1 Tax=Tunisvirus fontaine2 TaxID=1421067 RepID=V9SFZ9_9VIRU|nr:hypothetical protein D1R32_gp092 [Tunisvirus fontaine2]AHC54809.1 hypothetical protein TNS_ORF91 [Tunisvirus fontaine2]
MFSSGKKRRCVDDCIYRGYSTISGNAKDMVRIMDQINKEGHLRTICKQKCHTIENSRAYQRCERRVKEEYKDAPRKERDNFVKEECENDLRVRLTKAVFY